MTTKRKTRVSPSIVAKGRKVLKFARQRAKEVSNRMELRNALYTPDGMLTVTFPTREERRAFFQTSEYDKLIELLVSMPEPPLSDEVYEIRIPPFENGKKKSPARRRA
jgi:hypothetical protein